MNYLGMGPDSGNFSKRNPEIFGEDIKPVEEIVGKSFIRVCMDVAGKFLQSGVQAFREVTATNPNQPQ